MNLKNKNINIPGFVPGETREEKIKTVLIAIQKIETPREKHILRYTKRARIKKKYVDRLIARAVCEIFCRSIEKMIKETEAAEAGQCFTADNGS